MNRVTPEGALAIGVMMQRSERWMHRRVQTISFVDSETIRRDVSIDMTIPWIVEAPADGDEQADPEILPSLEPPDTNEDRWFVSVGLASGGNPTSADVQLPFLPIGFFNKVPDGDNEDPFDTRPESTLKNFDLKSSDGKALSFTDSYLSQQTAIEILSALTGDSVTPLEPDSEESSLIVKIVKSPRWAAKDALDEAAQSDSQGVRDLLATEYFSAWSKVLTSYLVGGVVTWPQELTSGMRVLVKYSIWEGSGVSRPSVMERFLRAAFTPNGAALFHHEPYEIVMQDVYGCASHHVEIVPPPGIRIQRAELVVFNGPFNFRRAETRVPAVKYTARLSDVLDYSAWCERAADQNREAEPLVRSRAGQMSPVLSDGPSHSLAHLYVNRDAIDPAMKLTRPREQRPIVTADGHRRTKKHGLWRPTRVKRFIPHYQADRRQDVVDESNGPRLNVGVRVYLRPRVGAVMVPGMLACISLAITQFLLYETEVWNWNDGTKSSASLAITVLLAVQAIFTQTYIRDGEEKVLTDMVLSVRFYLGLAVASASASAVAVAISGATHPTVSVRPWKWLNENHPGWISPIGGRQVWGFFLILSIAACLRLIFGLFAALRKDPNATFAINKNSHFRFGDLRLPVASVKSRHYTPRS